VKRFPAFGIFKNEAEFVKYDGDVGEETAVLTWALSPETLDLPGKTKLNFLLSKSMYILQRIEDLLIDYEFLKEKE
jgi:hypothetical protein